MERDMRQKLFDHYERLSYSYYDQNNSGQMMSKLVSYLFDISDTIPIHEISEALPWAVTDQNWKPVWDKIIVDNYADSIQSALLMISTSYVAQRSAMCTTALEKAVDPMRRAVQAVDEAGYGDCILCPETMGKVNQLGTLDEVLALCSVDERIIPCVDFGHLYARSQGTELNDETAPADYAAILDAIAAALPGERAKKFHAHFSRIAYTKGGEKCHLTFADTEFGPPPAPLMQLLKTRGLAPTIICESAGTQAEDAAALKKLYEQG